jgi:hypothetical protein
MADNLKARDPLGNLGVDGRIILKRILKKQGVRIRTGFMWFRTGYRWCVPVNMEMNLLGST